MSKPPNYRIFIKEAGETYLLCSLWQQKSDVSLMFRVNTPAGGTGDTIGKVKVQSNPFDIFYKQISKPIAIAHTSIHATGQSHVKMKDTSRTNINDKNATVIPLKDLATSKHLTTLVCKEMSDKDKKDLTRPGDIPIERPDTQRFTTLDLIAIPKSPNINFSVNREIEGNEEVALSINLHRLRFNGYDVLAFSRHSNQFDILPPMTIELPDMNDRIPFITKVDFEKITVNMSSLEFSQIIFNPSKGRG